MVFENPKLTNLTNCQNYFHGYTTVTYIWIQAIKNFLRFRFDLVLSRFFEVKIFVFRRLMQIIATNWLVKADCLEEDWEIDQIITLWIPIYDWFHKLFRLRFWLGLIPETGFKFHHGIKWFSSFLTKITNLTPIFSDWS